MKRVFSLLLCFMLLFVSAASAAEPRDSMYFNSYGSSLSAIGNGSIRISFTCDSVGMAAQRNPRHLTPENIGTPTCAAEHHSAALLFWGHKGIVSAPVESSTAKSFRSFPYGSGSIMLTEKELAQVAFDQSTRLFGKKYLQANYPNTYKGYGFVGEDRFMMFAGFKTLEDLPNHPSDEKGWTVYGHIWLDAHTGEILLFDYLTE